MNIQTFFYCVESDLGLIAFLIKGAKDKGSKTLLHCAVKCAISSGQFGAYPSPIPQARILIMIVIVARPPPIKIQNGRAFFKNAEVNLWRYADARIRTQGRQNNCAVSRIGIDEQIGCELLAVKMIVFKDQKQWDFKIA